MNIERRGFLGGLAALVAVPIPYFGITKSSGHDYYWGHMGKITNVSSTTFVSCEWERGGRNFDIANASFESLEAKEYWLAGHSTKKNDYITEYRSFGTLLTKPPNKSIAQTRACSGQLNIDTQMIFSSIYFHGSYGGIMYHSDGIDNAVDKRTIENKTLDIFHTGSRVEQYDSLSVTGSKCKFKLNGMDKPESFTKKGLPYGYDNPYAPYSKSQRQGLTQGKATQNPIRVKFRLSPNWGYMPLNWTEFLSEKSQRFLERYI